MSRTVNGRGQDLSAALSEAIAAVVGADREKVELSVDAPGLGDVTGELRLELQIVPEDSAGDTHREQSGGDAALEASDDDMAASDDDGESAAEDHDDAAAEAAPEDHDAAEVEVTPEDLDEEADAAADFIEGLLDAMDLPGDLRIKVHSDHAELEVVEVGSGALIGRRGQTLEALQELVRCSLQREFQRRARVKVDVEGYRARRLEKLLEKAEEAIDTVLDGGEPERLEPMDVFERKAVHRLVAEVEGVTSRSQGREPARRVVIEQA